MGEYQVSLTFSVENCLADGVSARSQKVSPPLPDELAYCRNMQAAAGTDLSWPGDLPRSVVVTAQSSY